jgi:hypothetical protein
VVAVTRNTAGSGNVKKTFCFAIPIIVGVTVAGSIWPAQEKSGNKQSGASALDHRAIDYLAKVMDQFHATYDVYTDADAAGNHFVVRPRMSSFDNSCQPSEAEETVPPMDEAWMVNPHSGLTCIRASFKSKVIDSGFNWGAWYFMNGIQVEAGFTEKHWPERCPKAAQDAASRRSIFSMELPNWGHYQNSGVTQLTDATNLTFWARGEKGGERVEFFALGVGWDADYAKLHHKDVNQIDDLTADPTDLFPHPDSSPKLTTGYVTLSRDWKQYSLNLKGRGLSYVLGGFGWAANATENGLRDINFYMDDIRYELDQAARTARLNEPRFLVSYETKTSELDFDKVMRNAAHSYDNALALMAFLAAGDTRRARLIADAFLAAQNNDRFVTKDGTRPAEYKGSLRNAYQGGDLFLPPGWTSNGKTKTMRMPGWYVKTVPLFQNGDVRNLEGLVSRFLEPRDPLSLFLRDHLAAGVLQQLTQDNCALPAEKERRQILVDELNRLLKEDFKVKFIYDDQRFKGVTLDKDTQGLLNKHPQGEELIRLNRQLLEAAYPDDLQRTSERWLEDEYSVSLDTGNMAWAILALLAYHETEMNGSDSKYLTAAKEMGEWVQQNCYDATGKGGYTGGFKGWEPNPTKATYKATEHNIDLYAAFQRLYFITHQPKWHERAEHARSFVKAMWDRVEGKFWTGTDRDGVTINEAVVPLDIQAWAVLSLNDDQALSTEDRTRALSYVEQYMKLPGGYDYSRRHSRREHGYQGSEGVWYEGTAQMAVAYDKLGNQVKGRELLALLKAAQTPAGSLPASDQKYGLRTGFQLSNGDCNRYFQRAHVGATAWLALAEHRVNPFWMGSKAGQ